MIIREGLTFDDVLLVPRFSELESRESVDLSVSVPKLGWKFAHPIVPANMKSVASRSLLHVALDEGSWAFMNRFDTINQQVEIFLGLVSRGDARRTAVSLGVQPKDHDVAQRFRDMGAKVFCVDVAHGDSKLAVDMVEWLRMSYGDGATYIIAGNVATARGARRLWDAGANAVKVGVGPGSLCTTRLETGCGVPQVTALDDVATAREKHGYDTQTIISDGGVKCAGDIVKALCFADFVMTGNLFAGCMEAPGDIQKIDGREYKEYVGSSTHKTTHVEGVEALVPLKGTFHNVLQKLKDGVRSGCSYQGVRSVRDLQLNPEFIRQTSAGRAESAPHDVMVRP